MGVELMKHVFALAGAALLGYAIWRNHNASMTVLGTADASGTYNGGVANTSGNNMSPGAATNIGAGVNPGPDATIMPVTSSSPAALAFMNFGGGSAAHPLDY